MRLSPEEAAGQLVRLTPSWSELLRAWDTLHDGHRAQDAAVPLLGALADVLWVRPGGATQAHTVLHVSLDGLARTVRVCLRVWHVAQSNDVSNNSLFPACIAPIPHQLLSVGVQVPAALVQPPVQHQQAAQRGSLQPAGRHCVQG